MATSPVNTYTYAQVQPARPNPKAITESVALAPSLTLAKYAAYNNANSNGTEVARMILMYAVTTDASGNVVDEQGNTSPTAVAYISGVFNLDDITGLDAAGVADLCARFINGGIGTASSIFVF
jgi:hypothetical protein